MLKQTSTRIKLLLFPFIFMIIVVVVGTLYTYYSGISDVANEEAHKTDVFTQHVLKGRISVYQYLRSPSEQTAQKVRDDFSLLSKEVLELKNELDSDKDKILCDEIIANSKKYIDLLTGEELFVTGDRLELIIDGESSRIIKRI